MLAAVAIGWLAIAAAPPFARGAPFQVEAERFHASVAEGIYVAEGNAVMRRPGLVVHAERLVFDEAHQTVVAEGRVVVLEDSTVLTCERVALSVPELLGGIANAELRIKSGLGFEDLAAMDPAIALETGRDELIVRADDAIRLAPRVIEVRGASVTPCDCGEGEAPSFRISAARASVDLDSGAFLTFPVFYVKDVPVFALPAFYVPLGERRTGLLLPRLGVSSVTGVYVAEPLYIVLGRSWDSTVEAGYYFSRGPAPGLELRWAPSRASEGALQASLLLDYGVSSTDEDGDVVWSTDRASPIVRFAAGGGHRTRFGDASQLAVELNVTGDPAYVSELANEYLERQVETTVSRATYSAFTGPGVRIAAGLQLLQDLRSTTYGSGVDLREVSLFSGELAPSLDAGPGLVRYRFADLRLDAPPYPLFGGAGPLYGEAVLAASAFSAPRPEVARFARADMRPGLLLPLDLFGLAVLEPRAALRLTAWSGRSDGDGESTTRIGLVAGARLFTEISRRFGELRHVIRPSLRHVIVPFVEGKGPGPFETNDEIDLLAPVHQVAAILETDLWLTGRGARRVAHLSATLGEDLGLGDHPGAGTAPLLVEGDLDLRFGGSLRTTIGGLAAYDLEDGRLEEVRVRATLGASSVANVSALWAWLDGPVAPTIGAPVPEASFIAPEEIVPSRTIPRDDLLWSRYQGLVLSAFVRPWAPLDLSASVNLDFTAEERDRSLLRNVTGSIGFESPCECWSARVVASFSEDRDFAPDLRFMLDLARLGQVSTP